MALKLTTKLPSSRFAEGIALGGVAVLGGMLLFEHIRPRTQQVVECPKCPSIAQPATQLSDSHLESSHRTMEKRDESLRRTLQERDELLRVIATYPDQWQRRTAEEILEYNSLLRSLYTRRGQGRGPIQDNFIEIGGGGGIVFTSRGHFITAHHVVKHHDLRKGDTFPVFYKGKRYNATILTWNDGSDTAFGMIDPPLASEFKLLVPFAKLEDIKSGMPVELYGRQDNRRYFQKGIIKDVASDARLGGSKIIYETVRTNAPGGPGYSGGPVFTEDGRLIGIVAYSNNVSDDTGVNTGVARIDHFEKIIEHWKNILLQKLLHQDK